MGLRSDSTYTIVDIEPALSISRWYLTQLFDTSRLTFLTPDQIDCIEHRRFDLAISISSLQEMVPSQVTTYLELFDRVADNVYLKQWTTWHNPVDNIEMRFQDYPFPSRWSRLLWEPCPVQTRFTQGVWTTKAT